MILQQRRPGIYATTAVLAAIVVAVIYAGSIASGRRDRVGPRLETGKNLIDLGIALPGAALVAEFPIRNVGGAPLRVSELHTSCGCAPATIDRELLAPGDSAMVKVNFQLPFHSGTTDHAIRFHTNDPQRPEVSFSVHVLARWPVSANPVALHFPSVRLGKGARQEVEIVSTTGTPFELTEIRVSSREVDVKQVHRDQRRAVLAVEVRPSTVGPIHETIEVATTVPERPTLVIPVEGESVTGVGYSPRIIFMGRKTPGSAHHAEIAVSTGEQEIGVTAVRIDEPGWSVTDWKIQPGSEREGEWSIHLDVAVPSTAGRVHGTLLIDSAKGTLKIPVSAIIASTSRESAVQ